LKMQSENYMQNIINPRIAESLQKLKNGRLLVDIRNCQIEKIVIVDKLIYKKERYDEEEESSKYN
jgi:hypothetical protein